MPGGVGGRGIKTPFLSLLLANPLVVHDLGSKETENHWVGRLPIKSGGYANPFTEPVKNFV